MHANTREETVLQILLALFAGWSSISLLGYLLDGRGPEFIWWICGGFGYPNKILFIEIPQSVKELLWFDFLGLFPRVELFTLAIAILSIVALVTKKRAMLTTVIGIAALHVASRLFHFLELISNSAAREAIGVQMIFKWTVVGLIVPLILGLLLSALLYPDKIGVLRDIRSKLVPAEVAMTPTHGQPPPPMHDPL